MRQVRRDEARDQKNADGTITRLDKTNLDHSVRAYLGFDHAFNEAVTFHNGIEYLQSVVHAYSARVNYDALLAAKLWGGLAVGAGFNLRYDNHPLPTVEHKLDTQTVLSIIYSYSSAAPPAKPEPEPCPPPPAPPICAVTPAPAAAPPPPPAPAPPDTPGSPAPSAAPPPAPGPAAP